MLIVLSLVASPGPDSVLIIRNTLGSGKFVGLAAVTGVQIGLAVHTLLAITGISLIVRSSELLFSILVILGSSYLCWLGLQAFIRPGGLMRVDGIKSGVRRSFRDAIITNILNTKAFVLFLAIMPSFILSGVAMAYEEQLFILALILVAVNSVWQTMLVYSADYLGRKLSSGILSILVSRVCGCFLFFFGILLLVEHIHVF